MNKKIVHLFLIITFCLLISSCGENNNNNDNSSGTTPQNNSSNQSSGGANIWDIKPRSESDYDFEEDVDGDVDDEISDGESPEEGNSPEGSGENIGETTTPKKEEKDIIINTGEETKVEGDTITVGTWNIGHINKYKGVTFTKIANKINEVGLDIIGMQEVNQSSTLANNISTASNIPNLFHTPTSAGNAILSKYNFSATSSTSLSSCGEGRKIQKVILSLEDGQNISFYNVHTSYSNCFLKHARDVYNIISKDTNPIILVGDFNAGKSGCANLTSVFNKYKHVGKDTVNDKKRCTDDIFISKELVLVSSKTYNTEKTLTDHNLVTATIKVPKKNTDTNTNE